MKYKRMQMTVERERIYMTACDICGENVCGQGNYQSDDVNLSAKIGVSYPECDCRECYELDCCGKCFLEKIKPLIEQNLKIKFREFHADDPEINRAVFNPNQKENHDYKTPSNRTK